MAPRRPRAPQSTAKAEARRRVSEKLGAIEALLSDYIAAGEDAERLHRELEALDERRGDLLVNLVGLVGRPMAAEMAGVDEATVRSAIARHSARTPQGTTPPGEDDSERTPLPGAGD